MKEKMEDKSAIVIANPTARDYEFANPDILTMSSSLISFTLFLDFFHGTPI